MNELINNSHFQIAVQAVIAEYVRNNSSQTGPAGPRGPQGLQGNSGLQRNSGLDEAGGNGVPR